MVSQTLLCVFINSLTSDADLLTTYRRVLTRLLCLLVDNTTRETAQPTHRYINCRHISQVFINITLNALVFHFSLVHYALSQNDRFLARDARAYAMMPVRLSVCLSVTEVHWRIIANLGLKFRSHFTSRAKLHS